MILFSKSFTKMIWEVKKMKDDILKLMQEVDESNSYEVQSVQWIIMALRAALLTGTIPELVGVVTEFAGGRTLELMEELVVAQNNNHQPVYE
jgi:hypothetical protein